MSVYLPDAEHTTYVYDFEFQGVRYKASTYQTTKKAALLVEAKKRLALRAEAAGIRVVTPAETPTFTAWADITLVYQTQFLTRPAILERTLRMILAFWGARPATPVGPPAVPRAERAPRPYHNLRLGDPIADPTWLEKFDQWMVDRQISASTRNSYLSACADLYTCALQPKYRALTGIASNPFAGIRRSPPRTRTVTLEVEEILALVGETSRYNGRHIAHALCIAALAPKLRVATILALEWARHLDAGLTTITVTDHKTARVSAPQVVPVSATLRALLADVRAGQVPASPFVITFKNRRVKGAVQSIRHGVRRAVEAVGLRWGARDGVTFHTIRHSIATLLADPAQVGPLTERLRADVMGHKELRTTQKYTHLKAAVQAAPHEALAAALPGLRAAVRPRHLAGTTPGGKSGGPSFARSRKPQQKPTLAFTPPDAQIGRNQRKA